MTASRPAIDWGMRTLLCLLLATVLGCGGGADGRRALRGTVTLDDQPLATGKITFVPAPGTDGTTTGGPISNGKFEILADKGLKPGKYLAKIEAWEETGRMIENPPGPPKAETAPIHFRQTDPLPANVTADSDEPFTFNLDRAKR
ncbi:MAG: hypothetical protein JW818_07615 [Pirellulales bacterium]|nr:hypothetical protein [Pirellulales bacterium]